MVAGDHRRRRRRREYMKARSRKISGALCHPPPAHILYHLSKLITKTFSEVLRKR